MGKADAHNDPDRDFGLDDDDEADTAYGPDYKTREGLPFCLAAGSVRNAMGGWWRTPEHKADEVEEARERNRAKYRAQVDKGWMPANAADFLKVWTAIDTRDIPPLIREAIQSGEDVSTIELLENLFPTDNIATILWWKRKEMEQDAA